MKQAERSTGMDRLDGRASGIVKRFDKVESAAEIPTSFGLINRIYKNSIQFTNISKGMRGMIMLIGFFTASLTSWGAYDNLIFTMGTGPVDLFYIFMVIVSVLFFVFSFYLAVKCVRLELFRPQDEPTIFDRKNRKVYRIYRESYSGWRGLLRHWPLKTAEYDWDLIDAEHQAALGPIGSTISRQHALIFLVRKNFTDSTIVDSFTVGNSMLMGEVTVPAIWEHIRRFMEEDGPHLNPGEIVQSSVPSDSFWKCMAATGPYGANFKIWWRKYTALMILGLILLPIVLPIITILGVFTWLAEKTATPIKWSPGVMAALGPELESW
jgi:uncharacterized membrane protein